MLSPTELFGRGDKSAGFLLTSPSRDGASLGPLDGLAAGGVEGRTDIAGEGDGLAGSESGLLTAGDGDDEALAGLFAPLAGSVRSVGFSEAADFDAV